jgi:hypothetical protein
VPSLVHGSWLPPVVAANTTASGRRTMRSSELSNEPEREEQAPGQRSPSGTVPALLPSHVQGSRPLVPSSAERTTRPPTPARLRGYDDSDEWSRTTAVPASVRSLRHSSAPAALDPLKYTAPAAAAKADGRGWNGSRTGVTVPTTLVPGSVPSLLHSRSPAGERAMKASCPCHPTRPVGQLGVAPGGGRASRAVPASVPSLRHSSRWPWPSLAEKYTIPPATVISAGLPWTGAGARSLTITVPASVPSLRHSSGPCTSSLARNTMPPPKGTTSRMASFTFVDSRFTRRVVPGELSVTQSPEPPASEAAK